MFGTMPRAFALVALCGLLVGCGAVSDRPTPTPAGFDAASPDVGMDAAGGDVGPLCIGCTPASSAWTAKPGPVVADPDAGADADAAATTDAGPTSSPTAVGAPAPTSMLTDFQPQSCGFKATYSLEPFKGKVTVAALLAGW
jgi:hypothetical protein